MNATHERKLNTFIVFIAWDELCVNGRLPVLKSTKVLKTFLRCPLIITHLLKVCRNHYIAVPLDVLHRHSIQIFVHFYFFATEPLPVSFSPFYSCLISFISSSSSYSFFLHVAVVIYGTCAHMAMSRHGNDSNLVKVIFVGSARRVWIVVKRCNTPRNTQVELRNTHTCEEASSHFAMN